MINHHTNALIAFPMMIHLIDMAFESLKLVKYVILSSLATIITYFSDDSSFDQLYIIKFDPPRLKFFSLFLAEFEIKG